MSESIELIIPNRVENLQLPSPELLLYYEDLEDRIIWIDYEINENVLEVTKKILRWNKIDAEKPVAERTPIRLLIFSPGGDLYSCLNLTDILLLSQTPVIGFNMGEASSAALLILLACQKRFCLKNSTAVLHKGGGSFSGVASQIDSSVGYYKTQLIRMKEFILERTNIDQKLYRRKQDEDWYMNAEEQVKYGVATIIDDIETIIGGESTQC